MCNIIIKGKTPFEKAKSFITQYSTYTALPAEEKEKFNDYLTAETVTISPFASLSTVNVIVSPALRITILSASFTATL